MVKEWSWTDSNGTATKEQTESAYNAITCNGSCSQFCCVVWNDLVNLLKASLDERGIEWKDDYAKFSEVLVGESNKILTAKMFNAVVQNMRYPFWCWESDPDSKGYLDRLEVKKGDTVYGCYLEDLPKYLNVIIRIFNGTANTYDYSYFETFNSTYLADIVSLPSSVINVTHYLDNLSHNSELVAKPRVLAEAIDKLKLQHSAKAVRSESNPVRIFHDSRLRNFMTLITVYGQLAFTGAFNLDHDMIFNVGSSVLIPNIVRDINLSHDMTAITAPTVKVNGNGLITVNGSGNLIKKIGGNVNADVNAIHSLFATLKLIRQISFNSDVPIDLKTIGNMSAKINKAMMSDFAIGIRTVGSMKSTRVTSTSGSTENVIDMGGILDKSRPRYIGGQTAENVESTGRIIQKPTTRFRGNSDNKISAIGEIVKRSLLSLSGSVRLGVNMLATIGDIPLDPSWSYPVRNGNELYIPQSYHTDKIENGIRIAWKTPVKTGDELYIPQVFHADQKENKLVIVYYSPVKTDNTLYIKQMNGDFNGG